MDWSLQSCPSFSYAGMIGEVTIVCFSLEKLIIISSVCEGRCAHTYHGVKLGGECRCSCPGGVSAVVKGQPSVVSFLP